LQRALGQLTSTLKLRKRSGESPLSAPLGYRLQRGEYLQTLAAQIGIAIIPRELRAH